MLILETERLELYTISPADAPFIYRLLNDPDWLRFIGDRNIKNPEDAKRYIEQKMMPSYQAYGFGFYLVKLHETDTSIGVCGLVKRAFMEHVDIGFAFLPEFRGNGYAFEAASAVLDYGKNELEINPIVAITAPENARSIKLLEKLGLKFSKIIPYANEAVMCSLYVPEEFGKDMLR